MSAKPTIRTDCEGCHFLQCFTNGITKPLDGSCNLGKLSTKGMVDGYCRHKRTDPVPNDITPAQINDEDKQYTLILYGCMLPQSGLLDKIKQYSNFIHRPGQIIVIVSNKTANELNEIVQLNKSMGLRYTIHVVADAPTGRGAIHNAVIYARGNWVAFTDMNGELSEQLVCQFISSTDNIDNHLLFAKKGKDVLWQAIMPRFAFDQMGGHNDKLAWDKIKSFDNWEKHAAIQH